MTKDTSSPPSQHQSTQPEDDFISLFAELFGLEKTQLLVPEFPVLDIEGGARYIDFALRAGSKKIAFEVDGPTHYQPPAFDRHKYEDDLLRQNSLMHQGWQVYRWTDHELDQRRERVKEQLALFLERVPGLLDMDDFLPKQRASKADFNLRTHQQDALDWLERIRAEGTTIALLGHATGAGKTFTAIEDARRIGAPVLYVAHTKNLIRQTERAVSAQWPEATTGLIQGGRCEPNAQFVLATVQSLNNRLSEIDPGHFRYLIIDEAHHAAADSYQQVLAYFRPDFTLGLTATPERPDGKPILDIFRDTAHRLSLKEAIERDELAPIRCVRVKTNVDLTRVRFNEVQYHRQDLEQAITIPARDELIAQTYLDHVRGRKAVTFAVNIRHGEALAERYRSQGIPARAVSGQMPNKERDAVLDAFACGDLHMLCACDLLNEGWDCPDIEVLLMARPTLSKIIYMQQLGRGTRKAPGKDCLLVFDFVDNAGRYNQSWNVHRATGNRQYRPGGYAAAPKHRIEDEERNGPQDAIILNLGLWTEYFEEIDVFDWQSTVKDMLPVAELERQLTASEGYLRNKVLQGELTPDHDLSLGRRRYFYFAKARKQAIADQFGLKPVTAANIRERFFEFCEDMDMSASYKPVLLRALLDTVDEDGKVSLSLLTLAFRDFYLDRLNCGLPAEKGKLRMARVKELSESEIQQVILGMPFKKYAQRGFLDYARDLSQVRIMPALWKQLDGQELDRLRGVAENAITAYFAR
ncbi:DEAD/DEAH box helicase family protein [Thiorhodovibrio frisius]|uniref:DNA/RNA helicase, superfamily II n=1 Tax=Thiorhodovibrio frisius TaxID=631362 RepID=H8YWL4_9GAMM|nr:DEAD/DEAH box helicase family protein [Thiorhodovibrio frisius]EIC22840.1 DNA/RNA helicase, superfamily II [Thiorhodovibrio frisius]WPL22903.1 UvsW helicase [Thiorhodovibrio frisius]